MDYIEVFDNLKNEIRECKSLSELKGFENIFKNMTAFTKRYIDKMKKENPAECVRKPSLTSINRIAQFLNETIFPKNIKEIKTKELYEHYVKWCKTDPNRKVYGKYKFYAIMKLGRTVSFKHCLTGDYFIFAQNK